MDKATVSVGARGPTASVLHNDFAGVTHLAFSGDGALLALCSLGLVVVVYDVSGADLKRMGPRQAPPPPPFPHPNHHRHAAADADAAADIAGGGGAGRGGAERRPGAVRKCGDGPGQASAGPSAMRGATNDVTRDATRYATRDVWRGTRRGT